MSTSTMVSDKLNWLILLPERCGRRGQTRLQSLYEDREGGIHFVNSFVPVVHHVD